MLAFTVLQFFTALWYDNKRTTSSESPLNLFKVRQIFRSKVRVESDDFWDLYWEGRLAELQNQGRKEAILAISRLIRRVSRELGRPLRLLELGCGKGQIIGSLLEAHTRDCSAKTSIGVDYLRSSLETARRAYPFVTFVEGNFTDNDFVEKLGQFDIVMLVNALHEVFSSEYSEALGEVDVPLAKQKVIETFSLAANCLSTGGTLVLFDGLEQPEEMQRPVKIRFLSEQAQENFQIFAREYHLFHISYRTTDTPFVIELSQRDFTRYITKSIFLGKPLWQTERLESYQYFCLDEFRRMFEENRLEILELQTITVDEDKWQRIVEIETPGITFPDEHILIIAVRK